MRTRQVHLKVKIKSLAAEAKIIRSEERKAGPVLRYTLAEHRKGIVREVARESLLAYGFLRGLPYSRIETQNSSEPDWDSVMKMIHRFGAVWDSVGEETKEAFAERQAAERSAAAAWLKEAQAWRAEAAQAA